MRDALRDTGAHLWILLIVNYGILISHKIVMNYKRKLQDGFSIEKQIKGIIWRIYKSDIYSICGLQVGL